MALPPTERGPDGIDSRAARPLATYMAECFWPGVTAAKVADVATRAAGPSEATCLQLILIPDDEIVLGIFHAPSPDAVTRASRRAGLPSERIVECLAHQTPRAIPVGVSTRQDTLTAATPPPASSCRGDPSLATRGPAPDHRSRPDRSTP